MRLQNLRLIARTPTYSPCYATGVYCHPHPQKAIEGFAPTVRQILRFFFKAYFNSNFCPNHVCEIPHLLFVTLAKKQPVT